MSEKTYEFRFIAPIDKFEYNKERDSLTGTGTLIRLEIPTTNGRKYRFIEREQIKKDLVGAPLFLGEMKGIHKNFMGAYCGRVQEVYESGSILTSKIEIWNPQDPSNPNNNLDLISMVKPGWGLSLGGRVKFGIPTGKVNKGLRPIIDMVGMMANHVQLLSPTTRRGDPAAMLDAVMSVGESFELSGSEEVLDTVTREEFDKAIDEVKSIIKESIDKLSEEPNPDDTEGENQEPEIKVVEKKVVEYVKTRPNINIHVKGLGKDDKIEAK
jgi:hypothetical protein